MRRRGSGERLLEGGGGHVFERQPEDIAVRAEPFESPSEISLHGDALSTAGGDDSEQDAGAVCALLIEDKLVPRRSRAYCAPVAKPSRRQPSAAKKA